MNSSKGYVKSGKIKLLIEANDKVITGVSFIKKRPKILNKNDLINRAEKELKEYFNGKRYEFSIPMDLKGTDFQKKVWKATQKIPFGKTKSYGEIAKMIKNPKAVRAVGGALNKNPICIIIPCHRVIGKDGSMTGFGAGIKSKESLLEHENNH